MTLPDLEKLPPLKITIRFLLSQFFYEDDIEYMNLFIELLCYKKYLCKWGGGWCLKKLRLPGSRADLNNVLILTSPCKYIKCRRLKEDVKQILLSVL